MPLDDGRDLLGRVALESLLVLLAELMGVKAVSSSLAPALVAAWIVKQMIQPDFLDEVHPAGLPFWSYGASELDVNGSVSGLPSTLWCVICPTHARTFVSIWVRLSRQMDALHRKKGVDQRYVNSLSFIATIA